MTTTEIAKLVLDTYKQPNIQAFLQTIKFCEGADYNVIFGGYKFLNKYKDHPREMKRLRTKNGYLSSDAAGAYQFLSTTWDDLVKRYGKGLLPDFSPNSQDIACCLKICDRGAYRLLLAGDVEAAIVGRCNKEWASLPLSPYGQPTKDMKTVLAYYVKMGGKLK